MIENIHDVENAILLAGLGIDGAAAWLGVTTRTLRRAQHGGRHAELYRRALLMRAGFIGFINDSWRGWRIHGGELLYDGQSFTPGLILASFWQRQLTAELQRQLRHKKTGLEPVSHLVGSAD